MALFRKFFLALKRTFGGRAKLRKRKKPARIRFRRTRLKPKPKTASAKKKLLRKTKPSRKPKPKPKHKEKKPKKAAPISAKPPQENPGVLAGEVTHYFSRIGVCVVKITAGTIAVGDRLRISGHTSNFVQAVKSLQIENSDVKMARRGALVGLKTDKEARAGDKVYRLA